MSPWPVAAPFFPPLGVALGFDFGFIFGAGSGSSSEKDSHDGFISVTAKRMSNLTKRESTLKGDYRGSHLHY